MDAVRAVVDITAVLRDLGYVGLAILMVVETVFPPIPSEAVLPLAGYLAERGDLSFWLVLATATAGSVLGATLLYEAARRGGRPFAERFLRTARIPVRRLDDAERSFTRRGPVFVALGRCIPGVRSLVSLPAGVLRMPRRTFLACTLLGSLAWNAALAGAGYALGSGWRQVGDTIGPLSKPLVGAVVVVALAGAVLWWRRERRAAAAEREE